MGWAHWPARLQRLADGPLRNQAMSARDVWLDGGHNPNAANMIARFFAEAGDDAGQIDIVIGMLANKDAQGFLKLLAPVVRSVTAVPIPGHDCHSPEALCAMAQEAGIPRHAAAADVTAALRLIDQQPQATGRIAILGSLYLAGLVLAANAQMPD